MSHRYILVSDSVCITRIKDDPPVYQCWACELKLYHVVLVTPRELLDHVELHRHAGHEMPADALEKIQKELG